ncbi:MAG: membrane protein insertase YidC [Arcobacteraceae bacterium]|nr:membrane protein insertase YidC [Arcobacteraceae bacterium]
MALNDNTLNKQDTQKRILVATLLSFAFFIAYDFFYLQPQQVELQAQQAKVVEQKQVTSNVTTNSNSAPTLASTATSSSISPVVQVVDKSTIITTIQTKVNKIEIDNLGRIAQVTLKDERYVDKNGKSIQLFNATQLRPLEVRFADATLNGEAFKIPVVADLSNVDATSRAVKLTLTQQLSKTTLTKVLTFYPEGHYDLDISTSSNENYFITAGFRPDVAADMYADHGALLIKNDGTLTIIEDEDIERNEELVGIQAVSAFDRYYTTTLFNFKKNLQVTVMANKDESPESFIHVMNSAKLSGYAGPKEYKTIKALDKDLTGIIEYGWFTFIAKPMFAMLQFIQGYIGNWGWTIVITTILIKLVLYPLSYKGMVSMNRLKELSPKVKALQEKYKDDKQKASAHMMELYKKEGANPMGGCLPILLQIPVFFAIYRVLLNAIELKGSEWIWFIDDLTHTVSMDNLFDPYLILPIIMGVTMFVQQKITPNQIQDEAQRKMFQFLPVIFTFFFIFFEAGLVLYWTINNLFTVAQQYYINQIFARNKEIRHQEHLDTKHKKGK